MTLREMFYEPWDEPHDDEVFAKVALGSFRAQCRGIAEYDAYARHLGRDPERIQDWREIPPVPVSAFRSHVLSMVPESRGTTFETSGTTISRPGRVRIGTTMWYAFSIRHGFRRHVLPDVAKLPLVVFGPAHEEAPHASLWFMAQHVAEKFASGALWLVKGGEPRWGIADEALTHAMEERRPVLLFGTTLLFHAYFARCDREGVRFQLPQGSRAMDTGGAKGTRVDLARDAILSAFDRVLGIPPSHVVNEYGMAELGSQFYEETFLAAHEGRAARPGFTIPPWVRTRVLDPATMRQCPEAQPGVLVHYDLANVDVPLAIQTEDLGSMKEGRLILHGRLPEAERRGCSLPFEKFIELERKGA